MNAITVEPEETAALRQLVRRARGWIGAVEHDVPGQVAREQLLAELDAALGEGEHVPDIAEGNDFVDMAAGGVFAAGDEMRSSICGAGEWLPVPAWWVSVGLVYQPGVHPRCRRPVEGGRR